MLSETPSEKLLDNIQKWYNTHNVYHTDNVLNIFQVETKVLHDIIHKVNTMIGTSRANLNPFVPGYNRVLLITKNSSLVDNFKKLSTYDEYKITDLPNFPNTSNQNNNDSKIIFCQLNQIDITIIHMSESDYDFSFLKYIPSGFDMILMDAINDDPILNIIPLDSFSNISNSALVFSTKRFLSAKNFLTKGNT